MEQDYTALKQGKAAKNIAWNNNQQPTTEKQ
jgi:hypothetical protein